MRFLELSVVISVVVLLVCLPFAGANTVDIVHYGYGAKSVVNIFGGGYEGISVYAGVYMLEKTADTGQGSLWENGLIASFCMDIPEYSPQNSTTYQVTMPEQGPIPTDFLGEPMGSEKAEFLGKLWGKYYDQSWAQTGVTYTEQQKYEAASFAAAVWEIIYEDIPTSAAGWDITVDGTTGEKGFYCENFDGTTANNWLASLDTAGTGTELRAFCNDGTQDYLTAIPSNAIPEPATIFVLGFGGLLLLRADKTRCA